MRLADLVESGRRDLGAFDARRAAIAKSAFRGTGTSDGGADQSTGDREPGNGLVQRWFTP